MANPKIGFLHTGLEKNHKGQVAAFFKGLQSTNHNPGLDVDFLPIWIDAPGTLKDHADSLVDQGLTVLVAAGGSRSAVVAQTAVAAGNTPAKKSTPIVFTNVADPFGSGLVEDYDTPDKNITGTAALTAELDAKRLELLHELNPSWKEIGALVNKSRPNYLTEAAELKDAAGRLGISCRPVDAQDLAGITTAFNTTFPGLQVEAVLVTADALFNNLRDDIVALAKANSYPAIYQWREFVNKNTQGLMSYGSNINDGYNQAGIYAGNIVDTKKPSDLPIVVPTIANFELVINVKTAKDFRKDPNCKLKIPGSMLARASFVRK